MLVEEQGMRGAAVGYALGNVAAIEAVGDAGGGVGRGGAAGVKSDAWRGAAAGDALGEVAGAVQQKKQHDVGKGAEGDDTSGKQQEEQEAMLGRDARRSRGGGSSYME